MKILILNGPNLNLTGKRETKLYGTLSFDDYIKELRKRFPDLELDYHQTNVEGELINKMQEAGLTYNSIILNAGAYTHTSVAIGDTIRGIEIPVVEVHISNIFSREDFRHTSYISPYCIGSISGFGLDSYRLAIESLKTK
ncbi:MAG: 3-dehydroquinate dehydratase [Lentimicrobiaceae bacterium]|jgi:3-dehydroquinate dehydratase II|nr:3-dehydroquinate dehydratase [Lentimicrobiaceae bacterium]